MSKSYNTNRRRDRDDNDQFSGERYGNQRHQQTELKRREERIRRAREKRDDFYQENYQ